VPAAPTELGALIGALLGEGVEFILVGGAAAVIHGAPITTQDVDIVHDRRAENVDRLLRALERMDAAIADPAGRRIIPSRAALEGPGQSLLRTRFGRLDVLGALHDGRGYRELLPHTETVEFEGGSLRLIDLGTLIDIKATAGRARDRIVLPLLLELARRRDGSE
jgi:predicted nucleotidyltransferase